MSESAKLITLSTANSRMAMENAELRAEVERLTDAMSWSEAKAHKDNTELREKLANTEKELNEFKSISFQIVPGEHGQGVEIPCSPSSLRAGLEDLQKEWDGAEIRLANAEKERDEYYRRIDGLTDKVESLSPHGVCGCMYDTPDDLCAHHSPKIVSAIARAEAAEASLKSADIASIEISKEADEAKGCAN